MREKPFLTAAGCCTLITHQRAVGPLVKLEVKVKLSAESESVLQRASQRQRLKTEHIQQELKLK